MGRGETRKNEHPRLTDVVQMGGINVDEMVGGLNGCTVTPKDLIGGFEEGKEENIIKVLTRHWNFQRGELVPPCRKAAETGGQ